MASSEEAKHDILLIIAVSLFIFMTVGIGVLDEPVPSETIIP
ncbi:hypothetical protein [Gottschalkia acidurici]|nr:hypothetical protein [Gottschalkia acidurici]